MPLFHNMKLTAQEPSENKIRLEIFDAKLATKEDIKEGKQKQIENGRYSFFAWRKFINS